MKRWRSSKSTPVHTALPNEWFRERKLVFLVEIHKELHRGNNMEDPYVMTRTYGGVIPKSG